MLKILFILSLLFVGAVAQCNVDDHHPENGGYFYVGAAGISSDVNLDSAHGQRLPNNTWAVGIDYPYGQLRVGGRSPPCSEEPGCPFTLSSHTCSILRFCPPEGAQPADAQEVYLMASEDDMNTCNFNTATMIGRTLEANSLINGCVEYTFEEDHELTDYFFSSPDGCSQGQKLFVTIGDFEQTADQCAAIGDNSPRIRTCDCRFDQKESTLPEPCRTAFSDRCEFMTVKKDNCCEEGTCLSKLEDWTDELGKAAELERRSECDDAVPGLCYNEDGAGTDTNRQGSTNCCTNTCSKCGIEENPFAQWKMCTSGDGAAKTANCGFLSRYDNAAYVCDFSLCNEGDYWHPEGDAYKKFFAISADGGSSSGGGSIPSATQAPEEDSGAVSFGATGAFLLSVLAVFFN